MLWGLLIVLIAIALGILYLVIRSFSRKPEAENVYELGDGDEAAEPLGYVVDAAGAARIAEIAGARKGQTVILPQCGFTGHEVSLRVEMVHRYVQGDDTWIELEGQHQGQKLALEVHGGQEPDLSLCEGEPDIPIEMLQLTEDKLAELDETGDAAFRLKFRGAEWAFHESGECFFHEDGGPEAESFYGWEFREVDGLRMVYIEKWEDEPFRAGIATLVDPESVRLVQDQERTT